MVRIVRAGNALLVEPWCNELEKPLSFSRRLRNPNPRAPKKYIYKSERLYQLHKADGVQKAMVFGGLFQEVVKALKGARIPYEVTDRRDPIPGAELSRLRPLREMQPEVFAAILSAHGGIIDCATAFGKTFLIEQLTRIYPGQRILIVSRSASVVDSIYERVCRSGEEFKTKVSKCSGKYKYLPESDVIVVTDKSLHKIDDDWPTMVIYDEVHEAGGPEVVPSLVKFQDARMFGLSASPDGRTDGSNKAVTGLFGPVIYKVTYQQAESAGLVSKIRCFIIPTRTQLPIDFREGDDVDMRRQGYWANHMRNELIARVARCVRTSDQLLIMVEVVEHALYLKSLLPEFTLVHGPIGSKAWESFEKKGLVTPGMYVRDASPDVNTIRKAFEKAENMRVISTKCWRAGVDFPQLYALIRADGSPGEIDGVQVGGRLSRKTDNKREGVLFDFSDDFGVTYERRAESRIKGYESRGWEIRDDWVPPEGGRKGSS